MNKIIGIVLAIAVIAGGVWYFTQGQSSNETKDETTSAMTENEVKAENTSLKALMAKGKDTKCTYTSTEGGTKSNGTIYVSKEKGRGDFDVTESGTVKKGHMIFDNNTSYIWMDGDSNGIKMTYDASQADTNQTGVDPDKNYDYECDSWKADSSLFVPPSEITFQELAIPQMPTSTTPNTMDKSAICNSLPEPAKSQCLSSM